MSARLSAFNHLFKFVHKSPDTVYESMVLPGPDDARSFDCFAFFFMPEVVSYKHFCIVDIPVAGNLLTNLKILLKTRCIFRQLETPMSRNFKISRLDMASALGVSKSVDYILGV